VGKGVENVFVDTGLATNFENDSECWRALEHPTHRQLRRRLEEILKDTDNVATPFINAMLGRVREFLHFTTKDFCSELIKTSIFLDMMHYLNPFVPSYRRIFCRVLSFYSSFSSLSSFAM